MIKEIGCREEAYVHICMESVDGMDIQVELHYLKGLLVSYSSHKMKDNTLVAPVSLTNDVAKKLEEGDKLYFKIYKKTGEKSVPLTKKDKESREYPIVYTKKEKITSLKFYGDKACKEAVSSAAKGSTIYARALTRNLSGKSLKLKLQKKTPSWLWDPRSA